MLDEIVDVDCQFSDGRVIKAGPFTNPGSQGAPPSPIPDDTYRQQAQEWLSTMGAAQFPYSGITFVVRRTQRRWR